MGACVRMHAQPASSWARSPTIRPMPNLHCRGAVGLGCGLRAICSLHACIKDQGDRHQTGV